MGNLYIFSFGVLVPFSPISETDIKVRRIRLI